MKRLPLLLICLLLAACSPDSQEPTGEAPTSEAPPSAEPVIIPDEVDATPPPDSPASGEAAAVALGTPFYVGRGMIHEAVILAGAQQAAIAQGGGISLVSTLDARELWWHPTDLPIIGLTASPDGQRIAALLRDRSILIVDTASGRAVNRFATLENRAALWGVLAWSPDGTRIAFQTLGYSKDPIYLLDPLTGEFAEIPNTRPAESFSPVLYWSPDSSLISARKDSACVGFVDVTTGEFAVPPLSAPGATLEQGPGGCLDPIAWTPDGQYLLRHTTEGVGLVDPARDVLERTYLEAEFPTTFDQSRPLAAFSEDGVLLAGGGVIDTYWGTRTALRIWNARDNVLITSLGWDDPLPEEEYDERSRTRIAMAFDGETLVSVHLNGTISRWDFRQGREGYREVGRIRLMIPALPLVWSYDSRLLATTSSGFRGVAIWSVSSAEPLAMFDPPYTSPAISPDGWYVAMIDPVAGSLYVTRIGGQEAEVLPDATGLRSPYGYAPGSEREWGGVAYSPDGRFLAYRSHNRVIVVGGQSPHDRAAVLEGHAADHDVRLILWSPRGDALITVAGPGDIADQNTARGEIILWRVEGSSFTEVFRTTTHHYDYDLWATIHALFNPSGSLAAIRQSTGNSVGSFRVHVVDPQTGSVVQMLNNHYSLQSWMSDDELISLAYSAGAIDRRFTNIRTGEDRWLSANTTGSETSWGRFFATNNDPTANKIYVIDWLTGDVVDSSGWPGLNSSQIAWSPDGRWLIAYMGDEGMLMVWPVRHGE